MHFKTDGDLEQDAHLYLDDEGTIVVAVQEGLLTPRAEAVVRKVLLLLGEHFGDVPQYPVELPLGKCVDHRT